MKKIYLLFLTVCTLFFFPACFIGKDYADRLPHTWELTRVAISKRDKPENMVFSGGIFRFYPSGSMEYKNPQGKIYSGTWKLKHHREVSAFDKDGTSVDALYIVLADFENHELKSEIFDDIVFKGDNSFTAYVYRNGRNEFHFKKLP